jgi:two-component system, NarL family, response regulator NreC
MLLGASRRTSRNLAGPKAKDRTGSRTHKRSSTLTGMIKILLAEGHAMVRDAIAQYLAKEPDFVVLEPCAKAVEAIAVARQDAPHVALISVTLPGGDAFETAATIQAICPGVCVVFLTTHADDEQIAQALVVKAKGILTKQNSLSELPTSIREAVGGGTYFSEEIRRRLIIDSEGVRLAGRE